MDISSFRNQYGWLFIVAAAVTWGLDLLFRSPMTTAGLDPALIVFGEHLLLTIAFLPALIANRSTFRALSTKQKMLLLFIAWGSSAAATWLYTLAFVYGSALSAILLQKTQPIFALLLAPIFLGERRKAFFWPLSAVAFIGAYLLALGWTSPLVAIHDSHWKAAACAMLASVLWGAGTVAGRALSSVLSPIALSAGRFALAFPLLSLALFIHPQAMATISHFTGKIAIDWLLLAALPGLVGMILYYYGIQTTPASVATLAELAYPATALFVGYLALHQTLNFVQLGGLAILLLAIQRIAVASAVVSDISVAELAAG